MKKETKEVLLGELYQGKALTMKDVERLFDIYAEMEISSKEDLWKDHRCFFELIRNNKIVFDENERYESILSAHRRVVALKCISDNMRFSDRAKHQINFAEEVKEIVRHDKKVKILEVGSGVIPYSSILLGENGYDISSIDQFYLPSQCLHKMNVKSFRQFFQENFDVKRFDVVVGRQPCSAIDSMVSACSKQKVPYFMKLCSCGLSEECEVSEWQPILKSIDSNIQFSGAYAYNFENSSFGKPDNIDEIIEMDQEILGIS